MLSIVWIHTFHGFRHSPNGDLEVLGWFKKEGAEKICYFRGDPKFKGGAVTFKDIMHLENISFFMIIYMLVKLGLVLSFWEWIKFWNVMLILWCDFQVIWFFCLEFHFQLKFNSSSLIRVIWCFAGRVTIIIFILVLHQ